MVRRIENPWYHGETYDDCPSPSVAEFVLVTGAVPGDVITIEHDLAGILTVTVIVWDDADIEFRPVDGGGNRLPHYVRAFLVEGDSDEEGT